MTSVSGAKSAGYCYDRNGNMVSGDGRSIVTSAYDLPVRIDKGLNRVEFVYGPERQRIRRIDTLADGVTTTHYVGGKAMEVLRKPDGSLEKRLFVGDFALVSQVTSGGATTVSTRYLHRDHLGSIDAVTDASGVLIERLSFDAWGKRRQANWLPMASISGLQSFSAYLNQGFTGHEMLDPVGLIHMNGRVYDPELGRFLSADPFVQDLSNLQAWNRYSYVLNNPLSMTDASGFFFEGIFKFIGNLFSEIVNAIGSVFKAVLNVPILRAAIQVVACGFSGPAGVAGCIAATGAIAAAAGGSITDALQAMAFTAASFGVWTGVGGVLHALEDTGLSAANLLVTPLVHGAVNGGLTVAQGGGFAEGFAAGALGQLGGIAADSSQLGDISGFAGKAIRSSVSGIAGGSASALTGGKFANGFVTAAFARMWNGEGAGGLVRGGLRAGIRGVDRGRTLIAERFPRTDPYGPDSGMRLPTWVSEGEAMAWPRMRDARFGRKSSASLVIPCPGHRSRWLRRLSVRRRRVWT